MPISGYLNGLISIGCGVILCHRYHHDDHTGLKRIHFTCNAVFARPFTCPVCCSCGWRCCIQLWAKIQLIIMPLSRLEFCLPRMSQIVNHQLYKFRSNVLCFMINCVLIEYLIYTDLFLQIMGLIYYFSSAVDALSAAAIINYCF